MCLVLIVGSVVMMAMAVAAITAVGVVGDNDFLIVQVRRVAGKWCWYCWSW